MKPKDFYIESFPGVDTQELQSGTLIVIEGADGSGRSTQISVLRDWLEKEGHATVEVGLKRSDWIGEELEEAKQGNILNPLTLSLFYATDFMDQLESKIFPALRAGFIVIADRYIYSLIARAMVRGVDENWIKQVYGMSIVPDAVFYLKVSPRLLAERNFRKNETLDYWESGMDIQRSGNMHESFIQYQTKLQRAFRKLQGEYGFEILDGNLTPEWITKQLKAKVSLLLAKAR